MVSVPEGFMLVERSIWTEQQVEAATACITRLKGVPGMRDCDLAMAAIDAAQCKAPYIALSDLLPTLQPHPDSIAWMVGTALWRTKEEAERDAAATGLPIVGLGPMTCAAPAEQHQGEPVAKLREGELIRMANKAAPHADRDNDMFYIAMGRLVEERYTHADPAEVERLRGIIRMHEKTVREQTDHLAYMRAQLAERDALLHSLDCAWNSHDGKERFGKLMRKVETLAASAEPCAAVEVDHDALVAAVCVLRSQGLGNLSAAVEEARTALERKPS